MDMQKGSTPYLERVTADNKIILHNYQVSIARDYACGLEGCTAKHKVNLIPGQILYPKYCEEHRTEHRRQQFLTALNQS